MNEEQYKFHFALASYHDHKAPRRERLSTLYFDLHQPMTSICSISTLLRMSIELVRIEQTIPEALQELCDELKALCDTLNRLHQDVRDREDSEEAVQNALDNYWNHRYLADQVSELAQRLKGFRPSLVGIVQGFDFWITSLSNAATHLWADLDIFANPGELQIPDEVREALALYLQMHHAEIGSNEMLRLLLEGATSLFYEVRAWAGVLCRHYPEDKVVETMLRLLNDPSDKVVRETADSVSYVRSRRLIPALIQNLHREFIDPTDVGWIGEALSHIPDERALAPLIQVLEQLIGNPSADRSIYPIAGIRKAIQAIGGPKATETLKHYFD